MKVDKKEIASVLVGGVLVITMFMMLWFVLWAGNIVFTN